MLEARAKTLKEQAKRAKFVEVEVQEAPHSLVARKLIGPSNLPTIRS